MFYSAQTLGEKEEYKKYLSIAGSLSKLFSESSVPFIHYRVVENIFCNVFSARNESRLDNTLDAVKGDLGVSLKTFMKTTGNGSSQKIAEFDELHSEYCNLNDQEQIAKIARYRNDRIDTTMAIYGLNEIIYHNVVRKLGTISLFELPLVKINIGRLRITKSNRNSIQFTDNTNNYYFSKTKSTLLQFFNTNNPIYEFHVTILDNPLEILDRFMPNALIPLIAGPEEIRNIVYLPLYSTRNISVREVAPASGLNQWNARGRDRDVDEVYIPVPKYIWDNYPYFFPQNDVRFSLHLPNRTILNAKMCQANNKGLMSYPNKDLGHWILRDVLQVREGELVTYSDLIEKGIDSVLIEKIDDGNYKIDFAKIGSYAEFSGNSDPGTVDPED